MPGKLKKREANVDCVRLPPAVPTCTVPFGCNPNRCTTDSSEEVIVAPVSIGHYRGARGLERAIEGGLGEVTDRRFS